MPGCDDAGIVEQIEAFERIKSAAAASQAHLASRFASSQRRELEQARTAGRRMPDQESSIGAQVGLARRESPREGRGAGPVRVVQLRHTETPGWLSWVGSAGGLQQFGQMTPLGGLHLSHPPPMPGGPRGAPPGSRMEIYVADWLQAA